MEQTSVDGKMATVRDTVLRTQLLSRRQRLRTAASAKRTERLAELLQEVDRALERMDAGAFGMCETCLEPIESDRLMLDPLCRNCLDHLSAAERRALELDLDLAFQVQRGLLPVRGQAIAGWEIAYSYESAGPVSGDYCDVIVPEQGGGFFLLGDVSGKGVAASMLMAQLHAIFRSLVTVTRSVTELIEKANRVFCQGNPSSSFATLVCGHVDGSGKVEICNAGHCHPLHVAGNNVRRVESTGLPVGLFFDADYPSQQLTLASGESLVLYTDGLSEAFNESGEQYGVERLAARVKDQSARAPGDLLAIVLEDCKNFRGRTPPRDDVTVMILQRETS